MKRKQEETFMNRLTSKRNGWLALLVGITGILAVVALLLFFVSLFQNIPSLAFMGRLNDTLNALTGLLSAGLVSALHPTLRTPAPRLSLLLLIGVWIGALAIMFGSWLIITGRSDVELSSYYYFFGNGLIGTWVWTLNHIARRQAPAVTWLHRLTAWGLIASLFMMVGLLGLYGILLGLDGSDYSPLLMVTGISFLGIGILYPLWCLRLGRWILSSR